MMSRPLPLALLQVPELVSGDLNDFATHVEGVARGYPGTELLIYPELHLSRSEEGQDQGAIAAGAEPVQEGPRHALLSQVAGDLRIWLCPGSVLERGGDNRVFNTALVYSPQGELVAAYRKVFPWRPYERCAPGLEFVVFDMPGFGRAGLSICYDAWFPEAARQLAWMGAEFIVNVVRTPTVDREQETVLARANAIVNQVFVASVNAAAPTGVGRSVLVDPEGRVLAGAPDAAASVLTAVIDLGQVSTVRRFGTAGLTRIWDQMRPDDEPIELPIYGGRIDPRTWAPADHELQIGEKPSRPGPSS